MNYNTLRNKPTINNRELIGDNTVTEVGGITEEQFTALLNTDLAPYYTKDQIDDLFSRSYVYREKSGSIVTFDCPASVNGIDKVVSEIVAVQSGTGDPSPTNVRPISGHTEANVVVSPTTDAEDGTTYTIDLGGTRYGCTLDVVSGVLTVDRVGVDLGTLTWNTLASGRHSTFISDGKFAPTNTDIANALSSQYIVSSAANMPNIDSSFCYGANGVANLLVNDSRYNGEDATAFKTHMNGVQLVYELQTPQTIQLTPTAVKSLLGTNNIWADSGDITVTALDRIIQG